MILADDWELEEEFKLNRDTYKYVTCKCIIYKCISDFTIPYYIHRHKYEDVRKYVSGEIEVKKGEIIPLYYTGYGIVSRNYCMNIFIDKMYKTSLSIDLIKINSFFEDITDYVKRQNKIAELIGI